MEEKKRTIIILLIFSVAALASGWLGRLVGSSYTGDPDQNPGLLLWIVLPLLSAVLLRIIFRTGWKDAGLKPALKNNGFWYLISILIYPVCVALVLALGAATGGVSFSKSAPLSLFPGLLLTVLLSGFIKNIFEEFAWRGFLTPKVDSVVKDTITGHLIVGLLWAAWHLPFLGFVFGYLSEGYLTLVPRFFLGAVAASCVYGEIRLATGSVWPAVIIHTIGGGVIGTLFYGNYITLSSGPAALFSPGTEGLLMSLLFFISAALLRLKRIKSYRT